MSIPDIFSKDIANAIIERINKLTPETRSQWGTMSVSQMLAHCCVTYEMIYSDKHPKPNFIVGFLLKTFVKKHVTNNVPYKHNIRTAPAFVISNSREFETEKNRLIDFINKTQDLGRNHFEGKASHSFGTLTAVEWNNLFYKHLDHHLRQFGV